MFKVILLGTGTSGGVPSLGCNCDVCRSTDPHDKRLRSAAMIETENTRILIDAGPDIRQQLLRVPFRKIDGVLITHIHYDHVGVLMICALSVSLVISISMAMKSLLRGCLIRCLTAFRRMQKNSIRELRNSNCIPFIRMSIIR